MRPVMKEPLVRMKKRGVVTTRHKAIVYILGFILALLVGALMLLAVGKNPIIAYRDMAVGSFGTKIASAETVRIAIPLLITSVAVGFAFKMKFWNIGAEGQILAGAVACSYIVIHSINNGNYIPRLPLHLIMVICALIGGALFGFLPAFFKTKWGTNETLFTLMLNYIAIQYVVYLQSLRTWQHPDSSYPKIIDFSTFTDGKVELPRLFGVHIGWIFALIIAVIAYFYLTRTKHGFEISVVGDSMNTARYAGMNTTWIQIRTLLVSGALAGFVGYLQVAGANHTLTETSAGGVGFTAITVAWLAKLNPFVMVPISIFIAMLQKGSLFIQSTMRIPASVADLLTGLILFFMLGCEFFIEYKLVFRGKRNVSHLEQKEVAE
ncbi:MAG: ABC transporter permease [Clostridiaceae bacterium]|nr:ABC transporter permease [Clostridiaceae bacterium]